MVSPVCRGAGPGDQHPPWSLPCGSYLLSCLQFTHSCHSRPLLLLLRSTNDLIAKPLSNAALQDMGWRALPRQAGLWPRLSCLHHRNKEAFDTTRKRWELQFFPVLCQIYYKMPMAEHWLSSSMDSCSVCLYRCTIPCLTRQAILLNKFSKANKCD